jgi:hypothetical protein
MVLFSSSPSDQKIGDPDGKVITDLHRNRVSECVETAEFSACEGVGKDYPGAGIHGPVELYAFFSVFMALAAQIQPGAGGGKDLYDPVGRSHAALFLEEGGTAADKEIRLQADGIISL